ncbi:hypothetical protein HDU79_009023 [Rhizoclosmatium sp. JEL0117]|nr:hypothetical protein HDU79_009023 [Rhizoclosmatium sp. JEL0117]
MSSRAVFALLTLFIVLDVLDTSNAPSTLPLLEVLSSVKAKADLIQQSSFNSSFHRDSEQPHRPGVYYQNTTALFKGKYTPTILSSDPNPLRGTFDWTTPGALSFHLFDDHSFADPYSSFVDGILRIKVPGRKGIEYTSKGSGRKVFTARRSRVLTVSVAGVHLLREGAIYLVGVSDGNSSATDTLDQAIEMIPNKESFERAKSFAMNIYQDAVKRLEFMVENEDDTEEIIPTMHSDVKCRFNIVLQLNPVEKHSQEVMNEYEQELIETRGLPETPLHPHPTLETSIQITSETCGLRLTSPQAVGIKIELYRRKTITYALLVILSTLLEVHALLTQAGYTTTPAKRSKVSQTTIGCMICYDAYLALIHFLLGGVLGGDAYLAFAAASFGKFVGFGVVGVRYLLDICKARGGGDVGEGGVGIFYSRFCTYIVGGIFFFYQFGASSPFITLVTGVIMTSILFFQDRIGPRAFIPEYFYPTRYDYHPMVSFSGDDETPAPHANTDKGAEES